MYQEYLTRGGWKAICIWINLKGEGWFVHKPGDKGESHPTLHNASGQAAEIFTVVPIPNYGLHPADIVDVWREEHPVNDHEDDALGGM
jgi:hypothetical protein